MNEVSHSYLPRSVSTKAISLFFILLMASAMLTRRLLPPMWMIFGIVEVAGFFIFAYRLTVRWRNIPESVFRHRILVTALLIRIVYVVFAYYFYSLMTGEPYEFEAADSKSYQETAEYLVSLFSNGGLGVYLETSTANGVSDTGFPLFLSLVYMTMGGAFVIIVPRLVNALLGAWTCILVYRLARRNFGGEAARIAAILAMLAPPLIYYCGLHLKETLMVFLLMLFVERADLLFRQNKLNIRLLVLVCLAGGSLFFFRTVLGAAAWLSLFTTLVFTKARFAGVAKRILYLFWFLVACLFIITGKVYNEAQAYITESADNQASQMRNFAEREDGNKLAEYGTRAVFIPLILPGPYPTLVNAGNFNSLMICGATYTRNVYVFFILVAFWIFYHEKLIRKHVFILAVLFSYLFILASSGFALSERFHLPAVPFLLILAAFGITRMNRRQARYFIPYLLVISVIILGWNYFKLAGRGLI